MDFQIDQHGAVADGKTLNTEAIQQTIDAAAVMGGRVVIGPGRWLTGSIELKSGVTLHLSENAVLLGSPDIDDYATHSWGHHSDRTPWHLVYAHQAENIAITGQGTINGNGRFFWKEDRPHEWAFFAEKHARPTPMVEISNCRNIRIENARMTNPPGWTLHLHDCDRAWIRGIHIDNIRFGPNSDGIDLTGCHDVMISDCYICTGDDAIALKTTEDSRSCEYITVTNCVLETSCAALRVGFESDQDFRYLTFSNCVIRNCSRAIDILSFCGARIEHVSFDNIVGVCDSGWPMDRPIEINLTETPNMYKVYHPQHPNYGVDKPVLKRGSIHGITISNCDLTTCGRVMMGATEGLDIHDILIDKLRLRMKMIDDPTELGRKAEGKAWFKGMQDLRAAPGAIVAENVRDLRIRNFILDWPEYPIDPEGVNLLQSDNRLANRSYYVDKLDGVLDGSAAPDFHAFWGRNVSGLLEARGLSANRDGVEAIHTEQSSLDIVR